MTKGKITPGVLALIDIINFTPQSRRQGEKYTEKYLDFFKNSIETIVQRYEYQVIKYLGDGALIFGKDIESYGAQIN
jgi:class 3 adenylate cyclase